MVFHSVPTLVQRFFPNRVWKKDGSGEEIYLTFDDGPVPGVTDYVLQELHKRNMKATFFMVGANVIKNPTLAKEVQAMGHGIGNHTFHHLNGWKTDQVKYIEDFEACNRILEDELDLQSTLFRPPYGMMTSSQAKKIKKTHEIVMWNVLSGDYDLNLKPEQIVANTNRHLDSGAIVVFHDQEKTEKIMKNILPDFLNQVLDFGYKTKAL